MIYSVKTYLVKEFCLLNTTIVSRLKWWATVFNIKNFFSIFQAILMKSAVMNVYYILGPSKKLILRINLLSSRFVYMVVVNEGIIYFRLGLPNSPSIWQDSPSSLFA